MSTSPALDRLIGALETGVLKIGGWLLGLAGIIVILIIIWGGLQYIQGNTEGGKKTILAAIIGLIIILFANVIIRLVNEFVTR